MLDELERGQPAATRSGGQVTLERVVVGCELWFPSLLPFIRS